MYFFRKSFFIALSKKSAPGRNIPPSSRQVKYKTCLLRKGTYYEGTLILFMFIF